jgi:hypothetical protein
MEPKTDSHAFLLRRPSFRRLAAWTFVVVAWMVLLPLGACAALLLPLNIVLVPAWLAVATSVGPLARRLEGSSPPSRARTAHDRAPALEARAQMT